MTNTQTTTTHENARGMYFRTVHFTTSVFKVVEIRYAGESQSSYRVVTKSNVKASFKNLKDAYEKAINMQAWIDSK